MKKIYLLIWRENKRNVKRLKHKIGKINCLNISYKFNSCYLTLRKGVQTKISPKTQKVSLL